MLIGSIDVTGMVCVNSRAQTRACEWPTVSQAALPNSPYFVEYERPIVPWRMALGRVDGETVVVILRDDVDGLTPFSVIRLAVFGKQIVGITDYIKSSSILEAAGSVAVEGA